MSRPADPPGETPLGAILRDMIAAEGPMAVDRFMALALGHPVHGYYRTRDPLGAAGDFTTAPEISQMFGELLGLWAAETWMSLGRPDPVRLVELGPGRGTLMSDALRAAAIVPDFGRAADLHLVETSPVLRDAQTVALAGRAPAPTWHDGLESVPPGPLLLLANEFLDALPIRQVVRGRAGWHERVVGLDEAGGLAFGLAPDPDPAAGPAAPEGTVVERPEAAAALVAAVARRVAREGGAALFIDYGHVRTGPGETLQAVSRHGFVPPLSRPGEVDLTAHVDFAAMARAAAREGAAVHGPAEQGAFLNRLGLAARTARLKRDAPPATRATLDAAAARLAGHGAGEMGSLFKVLAIAAPALPPPPGFG